MLFWRQLNWVSMNNQAHVNLEYVCILSHTKNSESPADRGLLTRKMAITYSIPESHFLCIVDQEGMRGLKSFHL